jgi:hypothetical protein
MKNKFILALGFVIAMAFSAHAISVSEINRMLNFTNCQKIIYSNTAIIDKSKQPKQILIIKEYYPGPVKVLIINKTKLEASINLENIAEDATIHKVAFQDALQKGYNQIILEINYSVYDRGVGKYLALSIIAFDEISRQYTEIFSYDLERNYHDNLENYDQLIRFRYTLLQNQIIISNEVNRCTCKNYRVKVPKKEEYEWQFIQFVKTKEIR